MEYNISKEFLEEEYIAKNRSAIDIAKELNCHYATIYNYLKKYQIPKKRQYKDITGEQFGSWIVEGLKESNHNGTIWWCVCKCGHRQGIHRHSLTQDKSTKCRSCADLAKRNIEKFRLTFYNHIKNESAGRRNIRFETSYEDLLKMLYDQNKRCALTDLPIKFSETHQGHWQGETTASLDRKDSSDFYHIDNVHWVHKDINRMKQCFSVDRFIELCCLVADKHRGINNVRDSEVS